MENNWEKQQKSQKDIGCSWLRSWISNLRTRQSQHSIVTVGLPYSCSRTIQILPAAVIIISVCCDVLWLLFILTSNDKGAAIPLMPTFFGVKSAERSKQQVQCLLDKFAIPWALAVPTNCPNLIPSYPRSFPLTACRGKSQVTLGGWNCWLLLPEFRQFQSDCRTESRE